MTSENTATKLQSNNEALEQPWFVVAVPVDGSQQPRTVRVDAPDRFAALARAVQPSAGQVRRLMRDLGMDENDGAQYDRARAAFLAALHDET